MYMFGAEVTKERKAIQVVGAMTPAKILFVDMCTEANLKR